MASNGPWISTAVQLPTDGQRVLCWLPHNTIHLPGGAGSEVRNAVIMKFAKDHFVKNPTKTGYTGSPHLWLGEGGSNKFFADVTHWMVLPLQP
ncbi:MAG: DUF551 domain-containing protein [Flavobacteriales bacterium]